MSHISLVFREMWGTRHSLRIEISLPDHRFARRICEQGWNSLNALARGGPSTCTRPCGALHSFATVPVWASCLIKYRNETMVDRTLRFFAGGSDVR